MSVIYSLCSDTGTRQITWGLSSDEDSISALQQYPQHPYFVPLPAGNWARGEWSLDLVGSL